MDIVSYSKVKGWAIEWEELLTHVVVSITTFNRHSYFSKRTELAEIPVIDILVVSETFVSKC